MMLIVTISGLLMACLGAPMSDCQAQSSCVQFNVSSNDGGSNCQVYFWWDNENPDCVKDDNDTVSHACDSDDEADKFDDFAAGFENAMFQQVTCGETAYFGLTDGSGCKQTGQIETVYNDFNFDAKCTGGGHCGGGNSKACKWSVDTPEKATAEPTKEPTKDPTTTAEPTKDPTTTAEPTKDPTTTAEPTKDPTTTAEPTKDPTTTAEPTKDPTTTAEPTKDPSATPTVSPSSSPSVTPTKGPSAAPTASPSSSPSVTPTKSPSIAPTYTVCDSDDALNVAFLLDESGSIDEPSWDLVKEFVTRLITFDINADAYISLFEYASFPAYEQFLDWTDNGASQQDIVDAMNNNRYNAGGLTFTWDATSRVLDEFFDYRQTCTDGCDTRQDVLFILTDGAPTDQVCPNITARVNQSNVDIVVIGIGDFDFQLVSCLDVQDNEADVWGIEDFGSDEFFALEERVRAKVCAGLYPATPSIRPDPSEAWVYDDGEVGLGPVPTSDGSGGKGGAADNGMSDGDNHHHGAYGVAQSETEEASASTVTELESMVLYAVIACVVLLLIVCGLMMYIICSRKRGQHSFQNQGHDQNQAQIQAQPQAPQQTVAAEI